MHLSDYCGLAYEWSKDDEPSTYQNWSDYGKVKDDLFSEAFVDSVVRYHKFSLSWSDCWMLNDMIRIPFILSIFRQAH
jgi:hypothetical protein